MLFELFGGLLEIVGDAILYFLKELLLWFVFITGALLLKLISLGKRPIGTGTTSHYQARPNPKDAAVEKVNKHDILPILVGTAFWIVVVATIVLLRFMI